MKRHGSDPMADKAVSNNMSNVISKQQEGERSTALRPTSRKSLKEAKSNRVERSPPKSTRRPPPLLKLGGNEIGKIGPSKEDSSLHCVLHPISKDKFSGQDLQKLFTFGSVAASKHTSLQLEKNKTIYGDKSKVTSSSPSNSVSKIRGDEKTYCALVKNMKSSKSSESTFKSAYQKIPSSRKSILRKSTGISYAPSKMQNERSKSQKQARSKVSSRNRVATAKSYSPGKSNKLKSRTGEKSIKSPRG